MKGRTIKDKIELGGIGLHTGRQIELKVIPDEQGAGIRFQRMDSHGGAFIPAHVSEVRATSFATIIGNNGTRVATVEHLMAALYACGIDSALIQVNGPEVPIMDGSSADFTEAILRMGMRELQKDRVYMRIKKPIKVEEGDRYVLAMPYDGLRVRYVIEFDHPLIGRQELELEVEEESFRELISPARTFGFLKDVEALRSAGLAQGGSLENAIVLDQRGVLNPEGLRFKDEFVRHKILDFLGDLALVGMPVMGHFEVRKSGHTLNHTFLKALMERRDTWEEQKAY